MAFPDDSNRRCKLTINPARISAAISGGFPLQILLADVPSDMMDAGSNSCLNGGGDIRGGNSDGTTRYALDVTRCVTNATAGSRQLELHMDMSDTISSSADTDLWLYYKEAAATQPAASNTYGSDNAYDSNFIVVSHDGGHTNATSNSNMTGYGTTPTSRAGQEPATLARDYGSHSQNYGYQLTITNAQSQTFEIQHQITNSVSSAYDFLCAAHNGAVSEYTAIYNYTFGPLYSIADGGASEFLNAGTPVANTWAMVSSAQNAGTEKEIYLAGASVGTDTSISAPNTGRTTFALGLAYDSASNLDGYIGEARYSDSRRADTWITATQDMIGDHSNFYSHTPTSEAWPASTNVTALPTGVAGTGSAGTITIGIIESPDVAVTGVAGTSSPGTITVGIEESPTVTPTGVAGTGSPGDITVSITGNVTANPVGVAGTGSPGSLSVVTDATQSLSGVQGTGSAGIIGVATYTLTDVIGVSGTGQVGNIGIEVDATVSITGAGGSGLPGTLTVSTGSNATASLVGVGGTGQVGTMLVISDVTLTMTGVSGAGSSGDLGVIASAVVELTGVTGTGAIGTLSILQSSLVVLDGVGSIGSVGEMIAAETGGLQTIYPDGVEGTGQVGSITIEMTGSWGVQSENDGTWSIQSVESDSWQDQVIETDGWTKQ